MAAVADGGVGEIEAVAEQRRRLGAVAAEVAGGAGHARTVGLIEVGDVGLAAAAAQEAEAMEVAADAAGVGVVAVIAARGIVAMVDGLRVAGLADAVVVGRIAGAGVVPEEALLWVGVARGVVDPEQDLGLAARRRADRFAHQVDVARPVRGVAVEAVEGPVAVLRARRLARVARQVVAVAAQPRAGGTSQEGTAAGGSCPGVSHLEGLIDPGDVARRVGGQDAQVVVAVGQAGGIERQLPKVAARAAGVVGVDRRRGEGAAVRRHLDRGAGRQTTAVEDLDLDPLRSADHGVPAGALHQHGGGRLIGSAGRHGQGTENLRIEPRDAVGIAVGDAHEVARGRHQPPHQALPR